MVQIPNCYRVARWTQRSQRGRSKNLLESHGMPRFKADWRAIGDLPTRRPTLAASDIRRCIQPEPGDDCERVAAARIYGDPFPVAALTEAAKLRRTQGALDQSSAAERERDRSGAIISMIDKRTMTAAESVGLGTQ